MKLNDITIGLREGLGIEQYHAGPGISKSGLDTIARSPAHFHALHMDPARPPRKTKAGQLEGELAHCATLEPAEFLRRYAVGPAVSRATKEWKAFVEANPGRTAIQPDQYDTAMRQAESVRKLPEIREALERGQPEVSAYWMDEETGVLCRCRPDWTHDCGGNGVILLDLKTYSDARADEFARQVARKRYHVQDAFYRDGYAAASGRDVLAFVFVAVESEWPHAASALMLDDASMAKGQRLYRRDLKTYADCLRADTWPGLGDSIHVINLPAWALNKDEA